MLWHSQAHSQTYHGWKRVAWYVFMVMTMTTFVYWLLQILFVYWRFFWTAFALHTECLKASILSNGKWIPHRGFNQIEVGQNLRKAVVKGTDTLQMYIYAKSQCQCDGKNFVAASTFKLAHTFTFAIETSVCTFHWAKDEFLDADDDDVRALFLHILMG